MASVSVTVAQLTPALQGITETPRAVTLDGTPASIVPTGAMAQLASVTVTSGILPPGLTLLPNGTFTGVATVAGTYVVALQICDVNSVCAQSLLTIMVSAADATLPVTGLGIDRLALWAFLLLLAGTTILRNSYRRRIHRSG